MAKKGYFAVWVFLLLLIGAVPAFDTACAQQILQRRATPRAATPQRNENTAAVQASPQVSSAMDPSSPLGQAPAACDKESPTEEVFALPGLKGDVTLDRCYKGRAHFVCVSLTLVSEAQALTKSYARIVEAKYPELNSVDSICGLKADALSTDVDGSQEFLKRFATLKSQYEVASRCTASLDQSLKDLALTDMTQPPDLQKSMSDAIDSDFSKVSDAQKQIAALAAQMEASKKALLTLDKLHRAMCMNQRTTASSN